MLAVQIAFALQAQVIWFQRNTFEQFRHAYSLMRHGGRILAARLVYVQAGYSGCGDSAGGGYWKCCHSSELFGAKDSRRDICRECERLPEWQTHIAKQDDQTKAVLDQALKVSKSGGVLNSSGHSAQLNGACWGAFFATGNPKFVDKVVDQLRYFDERSDEALFFSGATAMWSLATNSRTYTAVRSAIDSAKINADKRTQDLIVELLSDDPARIKQQIAEVVRTQRDAGKWK